MDPPYVPYHHHPKYVPYSSSLPPPPTAPFDPSPNLYASRHHDHHLPPPPPPPQEQQLSYQPRHSQPSLPQPPQQHHVPYNPHHPQITYNSSFNPNPQFSEFSHRSAPDSPHAARRVPELQIRLDYWSGNRQSWAQQAPNSDRESHYAQLDGRPASPANRCRHGFEGSSRFRNEYSEGFKLGPGERDGFVRLQDEYGVRDRSSVDFGIRSGIYELGFGKGDVRYDSSSDRQVIRVGTADKFRESARWVHDRQTLSGNEINNRYDSSSRKYDYQDSEVGMYDDRGRREDIYEVNRTPRKQVQKKSALLRIQMAKPNYRSREDERSHYSGYSSEMRSNFFRGKDQAVQSDDRMEADEREGSPVELDVSFKSNSLVAKAITPPCSSMVVSGTNLTPNNSKVRKVLVVDKVTSVASPIDSDTGSTSRNFKIRKATEIDKDSSSSPQKLNEATTRLDAAPVVHNLQSPKKNINQSEGKATSSVTGTVENISTKPCPERVKFSLKLSQNKRSQKAAAPSDAFSSGKNDCPVSHEDLNSSEKMDVSASSCDGETNFGTRPNSGVFSAAVRESIEGRPPEISVSTKADANLGKSSIRNAISDKVSEKLGKTICKSTISDKVASSPGKTSAKSTISSKVCANPGKISPEKAVMDKVAINLGKIPTKSINSVKLDANPDKTSCRSTPSDKFVIHPAKTLAKNVISGKKDDNTSKTSSRSTISGSVHANPGKTSSVKIVKKKKIVKKLVKKVTDRPLHLPNVKVTQNSDKPLCADSSSQSLPGAHKSVMPVKKTISSANLCSDGCSVHHVNLQDRSEAAILLTDNKVEDSSLKDTVLKKVATDINSVCQPKSMIHKKRKISQSAGSLPNIEGKLDDSFTNAGNSIPRPQTFSPVQDAHTEAVGEIISSSINIPIVGRLHDPRVMNFDAGLLRSEKKEVNDDILDTRSSCTAVDISGSFDPCLSDSEKIKSGSSELALSNTEEINKFHEISTLDATSNHTSVELRCQVIDTVNMESVTEMTTDPLNSEEAEVGSICLPADCTNRGVGTVLDSGICSINLGRVDGNLDDGSCGFLSKDGVVVLEEGSDKTLSSNARASIEDQEENASTGRNRKRKNQMPLVELPSSQSPRVRLGSAGEASSAKSLDATLSLFDANFPPMGKVGISDGRSLMETLSEARTSVQSGLELCGVDGLPLNKKQKLSTSSSSPRASVISEVPAVGQLSEPNAQLRTFSSDEFLHTSEDVKVSKVDAKYAAPHHSQVDCFSDNLELETPRCLSHCPSRTETDLSSMPFSPQNNHRTESAVVEVVGIEGVHVEAKENQPIGFVDVTKCRITSAQQSVGVVGRLTSAEDCELSSISKSLGFVAHGNNISTTSTVEMLAFASDRPLNESSPVSKDASLMCALNGKESLGQNSEPYICRDGKFPNQKPQIHGACCLSASMPCSDSVKTKTGPLPSHVPKYTSSTSGQMLGGRNQIIHPVPQNYPGRNVFVASRSMTSSNNIPKSRTWYRADNSSLSLSNKPSLNKVSPQTPMSYKVAKAETSYIRKGNSLVRKASSAPALRQETHSLSSYVYQLNSMGLNEVGKVSGTESRSDVLDSANSSRTVGIVASPGATWSPTMPAEITSANQPNDSSSNSTSGLIMEAPLIVVSESRADPSSPLEINDVVESSKGGTSISGTTKEISSVNNLENLNEQNERTMISSNANTTRYIKPRSNQLVATSDLSYPSGHIADNNQFCQPDGYYKRSKNQLIRTTVEGKVKRSISAQGNKVNAAMATGAFGKRQPHRVMGKIHKLSRFSLVWTLKNARVSNAGGQSCYPKIFPQLFPWKRLSYRRSMLTSGYNRNSNISSIGHKLFLLRERKTVYTRSKNGFSLRKSKVISVGGSSLKWSKSIERRSKKASEEATMAVAEAERKRREQNATACSTLMPESSGHSSCRVVHGTQLRRGERIFRIGSMRYKMDSSRRTLQRIPEDEVTCSTDLASGNKGNKSYVPRRLVIGNDEYVRIGNGNQLIKNPKKRTRVLASEKVRWSLHTARQRLVKKRKYCQFFTRFGKCNKDNGKCPYIHDPSKIAVCTKFLKGLCSNPICKLTHKVIPERMPDCSYFLQGLCTNEVCPYRHVYVNPKASTCEAFLRGYCADGNECRKKHSYVCPAFEATGSCPQGPKCKLHHPKKRLKEKRSKCSRERKNARGRYFGSVHLDISEPMKMVSGSRVTGDKDESKVEEELDDFISVDVSDDEDWKNYDAASEQATFGENDCLDLESEDMDDLIWPVRIMDKNPLT